MASPTDTTAPVWLNGEVADSGSATVLAVTAGLLTGEGAFETLAVYGGEPFALARHHERLVTSADRLGLAVPALDVVRDAIASVVGDFGDGRIRLRITVAAGVGTLVSCAPFPAWPPTADVVVVPWVRNERGALAGIKPTSYAENVVARRWAHGRGGGEAIFGNTVGHLCEGAASNVFLVEEGVLVTPTLASGCLPGVTRALAIVEAKRLGIAVEERDTKIGAFEGAEEAFLTSTTREIQPVARVDGRRLGRVNGELTAAVGEAYRQLLPKGGS